MDSAQREKLLKSGKTEEDKLFLAKLLDKAGQAGRGYLVVTRFMDPHQRALAKRVRELGYPIAFDGGYAEAERAIGLFPPDYLVGATEAETLSNVKNDSQYPIALVQVECGANPYSRDLTHRDYLGALMNLGIKRETIGDILVHEQSAQIIALKEIALYLESNLRQVGRSSAEAREIGLDKLVPPLCREEEKTATVASLRLDAVVAEGFQLSRSEASEAIEAGKVYLQFEECGNVSKPVEEGNIISLRGMGRILLQNIGGSSRKNRIFITLKKYV